MAGIPAKPISLRSGEVECQLALADHLLAIAEEAVGKGWSPGEIVVAIQEFANAWYLGQIGPETGSRRNWRGA